MLHTVDILQCCSAKTVLGCVKVPTYSGTGDGGTRKNKQPALMRYRPCVQATAMSSPEVSQQAVYQCTGNPLPSDIEHCYRWLMNETIAEAFSRAMLPFLISCSVTCAVAALAAHLPKTASCAAPADEI